MTYVSWRIDHIPYINNQWVAASLTSLTEIYDPNIQKELGDSKDSFSFKIQNTNGDYNNKFNANDKIVVYRVLNSESFNTTTDLMMVGTLKEPASEINYNTDTIRLEGYSFSEFVLGALAFGDYQVQAIPTAIQSALANIAGQNTNFKVTWHASNPTVRSDGSAFPNVGEKYYYKPIRDLIEKYSTATTTKDGNYYYYVDLNNQLRWFRGDNTSSTSVDISNDADVTNIKHTTDTSKIINFVICKGGYTPDGNPISTPYFDWPSIAKHSQKPYLLVSQSNTGAGLTRDDFIQSYGNTQQTTNYPNLTVSFTTSWKATKTQTVNWGSGTVNMTAGSTVTINTGTETNNKKAYNAVIKAEVIERLKVEAATLIENIRFGILKLDLETRPGSKTWGLGDRLSVTIPQVSSVALTLRIRSIQYTTTSDTYYLEQDIGTV